MSEGLGSTDVAGAAAGVDPGSQNETPAFDGKDNPAWEPFLRDIPSQLHPIVKTHLSNWDKGINSKFQEIHSQYAPWKQLADNGVDIETAQYALQVLQQLSADPRSIYDALGQHYSQEWGLEGNPGVEDFGNEDEALDPRIQQLQEQTDIMGQILMQQYESEQAAAADAEVEQELADLREKFGDFDEGIVVPLMVTGMSGEDAVQRYMQITQSAVEQSRRPMAPAILQSGGGLPSQQTDVTKMSGKETRGLVAELLARAQQG